MTQPLIITEKTADYLFFSNKVQGWITLLYENQKPLQGLAGLFDWRMKGQISYFLKKKSYFGKEGELIYLPFTQSHVIHHLFLIGQSDKAPETLLPQVLLKTQKLNLRSIGVSKNDFKSLTEGWLNQNLLPHLKGVSLWISH